MSGPWEAHAWRVQLSLQQLRHDLTQLLRDLRAVTACRLRGRHFLEPDADGGDHEWCTACAWCPACRDRRTDLLEPASEPLVLP